MGISYFFFIYDDNGNDFDECFFDNFYGCVCWGVRRCWEFEIERCWSSGLYVWLI